MSAYGVWAPGVVLIRLGSNGVLWAFDRLGWGVRGLAGHLNLVVALQSAETHRANKCRTRVRKSGDCKLHPLHPTLTITHTIFIFILCAHIQ